MQHSSVTIKPGFKKAPVDPDVLLSRLKRMGILSWHEPLLCLPKRYNDFTRPLALSDALPEEAVASPPALFALVVAERPYLIQEPRRMIRFNATDGMRTVRITIFVVKDVDVSFWKELAPGARINLFGALQSWGGRLQITGPEVIPPDVIGRVVPVYEKRRGRVAEGAIYEATRHALRYYLDDSVDFLKSSFARMDEQRLLSIVGISSPSIETLIRGLHDPVGPDEAELALTEARRFAAFSIVYQANLSRSKTPCPSSAIPLPRNILEKLAAKIPYPLTDDQKRTLREIIIDLGRPYPMKRVITGDVGCGKTITFMIPVFAVQQVGMRAVVLTPNSLLAEQFAAEARAMFGRDAPVLVVTSSTKTLNVVGNPVLVGTTALLNRLKNEPPPALLVVDEQQKFAVSQKTALAKMATNFIEATATPIPRTTALITHGGMDVSIIRQMPVMKNILTKIVSSVEATRLYSHTQKVIESGGQVAIVYPLVENDSKVKKSVTAAYEQWERKFPGQVAMLHGSLSEQDKLAAIKDLKMGIRKIAVVSTVIEIGLTIPSLKSLVVVNPERYGVSTLHQLRGRVARHGGNGYFFLFLPDPISPETADRLRLLERFTDGFALSEYDAQLRGYGDLFEDAERQHGGSRSTVFYCADLRPEDLHHFSGYEDEHNRKETSAAA